MTKKEETSCSMTEYISTLYFLTYPYDNLLHYCIAFMEFKRPTFIYYYCMYTDAKD